MKLNAKEVDRIASLLEAHHENIKADVPEETDDDYINDYKETMKELEGFIKKLRDSQVVRCEHCGNTKFHRKMEDVVKITWDGDTLSDELIGGDEEEEFKCTECGYELDTEFD